MRRALAAGVLAGASSLLVGCAGGAPLLHPAHVLPAGFVSVAGGISGEVALRTTASTSINRTDPGTLQALTVGPGVAPYIAGRVGLRDDNEAGLTYTGRLLRIDARHAFNLGRGLALSLGAGGSAIVAQEPGKTNDGVAVYGGGFDVPVLFGYRTASDLYAIWLGPRAGVELLRGTLNEAAPSDVPDEVNAKATHLYAGGLLGMQVGFRHVHVALEVEGAFHHANATFGASTLTITQVALTPAGALLVTF